MTNNHWQFGALRHGARLTLGVFVAAVSLAACLGPEQPDDPIGESESALSQLPAAEAIPVPLCPPEPACDPTIDVNQTPSLLLTRQTHASLLDNSFDLTSVLQTLIDRGNVTQSPANLFKRLYDTQNDAAGGTFSEAFQPHCDDDGSTINGFPVDCPRPEGVLTGEDPSLFIPVALFNRFDLAPRDGSHCGEYRIIYAQQGGPFGRNFIIFEAQLPNPNPQCGVEACRPVADFWHSLSSITDPAVLEQQLADFYYDGLPGFDPVITPENYGLGAGGGAYGQSGGQIRTNQFTGFQQWQLREFKIGRGCKTVSISPVPVEETADNSDTPDALIAKPIKKTVCKLFADPVSVKDNPFGELFDDTSSDPLAPLFQGDFVNDHVRNLAAPSLTGIALGSSDTYNAGQSTSQPFGGDPDHYANQLNAGGPFEAAIQAKLVSIFGSPTLTPTDIVERALTQSCAGCHQLSNNQNLGDGLVWPSSGGFVHVQESGAVSTALSTLFLPHREQVLEDFLQNCAPPGAPAPPPGGGGEESNGGGSEDLSGTLGGSNTH